MTRLDVDHGSVRVTATGDNGSVVEEKQFAVVVSCSGTVAVGNNDGDGYVRIPREVDLVLDRHDAYRLLSGLPDALAEVILRTRAAELGVPVYDDDEDDG